MTFFSFDFDTAMLQTAFWQKLFLDVVKKELLGNILLTVDCSLARYSPDEPKQITIKADTINLRTETFLLCPDDSSGLYGLHAAQRRLCRFRLRSQKTLTAKLAADSGCKLWLNLTGKLLEVFGTRAFILSSP